MHFLKTFVLLTGTALCSLAPSTLPAAFPGQASAQEDCTQIVKAVWLEKYAAEASTEGPCGENRLHLAVRNADGDIEFENYYAPDGLFGFYDVTTYQAMNLALTDWISAYAQESTSSKLPHWPEGAEGPQAGEFPFYPDRGVTRDIYEGVRAGDWPMVCFVQGMESQLCLVSNPETGYLESVGVQSFPG